MTAALCTQPGCAGQFEDGYCNVCGTPAEPRSGGGPVGSVATAGVRSASGPTGGSSRLPSSPIG
jgi:serine/threonine-protein kinase PknG